MEKRLTRGIAVFLFFFATSFSVIGCSSKSINKNSPMPYGSQDSFAEERIHIVHDASEAGLGPLTKENVTLAGIHIGDSQEQVFKLYGEPTKKELVHSTPFLGWYYENLGLTVTFYRRGEQEPIEGVVDLRISEPSKLTTNTGIGIGDAVESIANKYDEIYGSKPDAETNTRFVFIAGTDKAKNEQLNLYYPRLDFLLKNNQITYINLTNELDRP